MISILVTGASGQVGQELRYHHSRFPQWQFTFVDVAEMDITDPEAVNRFFAQHRFQYCINCAAYTAVDKAEENQAVAEAVNATGARLLAQACQDHQCHLLHLSTDYVYDNDCNRPLLEEDPVRPQSVYARTKLAGDEAVRDLLPEAWVIRTSWVYSSYGHNFVKTMQRLGRERDQLSIVFDQIGTPTYARHLAEALLQMIQVREQGNSVAGGIYHYSNEGVCSWYDFALAIFEMEGIDCQARPIVSSQYPTPARRPHYSVLNKQKICAAFGLEIPHWRAALKSCLQAIAAEKPANPA